MSAAASAVFNTFELLEMILCNLPMKDIARSQLLCRQVKRIIDRSPTLQQKLFLRPAAAKFYIQWPRHTPSTVNMALNLGVPVLLSSDQVKAEYEVRQSLCAAGLYRVAALHPMLDDGTHTADRTMLHTNFDLDALLRLPVGGASEQMFATQPPARRLVVLSYRSGDRMVCTTVKDAHGVRLLAIKNAVLSSKSGPLVSRDVHLGIPHLLNETSPFIAQACGIIDAAEARQLMCGLIPTPLRPNMRAHATETGRRPGYDHCGCADASVTAHGTMGD